MMDSAIPSLHEWMGGEARLAALFEEFYRRVRGNHILAPVFAARLSYATEEAPASVGARVIDRMSPRELWRIAMTG